MKTLTIYKDAAGEYRWRLRAHNNRTLGDSGEGYTRRRDAIRAATKTLSVGFIQAYFLKRDGMIALR